MKCMHFHLDGPVPGVLDSFNLLLFTFYFFGTHLRWSGLADSNPLSYEISCCQCYTVECHPSNSSASWTPGNSEVDTIIILILILDLPAQDLHALI